MMIPSNNFKAESKKMTSEFQVPRFLSQMIQEECKHLPTSGYNNKQYQNGIPGPLVIKKVNK